MHLELSIFIQRFEEFRLVAEAIKVDERRALEVSFDVRTCEDSPYWKHTIFSIQTIRGQPVALVTINLND